MSEVADTSERDDGAMLNSVRSLLKRLTAIKGPIRLRAIRDLPEFRSFYSKVHASGWWVSSPSEDQGEELPGKRFQMTMPGPGEPSVFYRRPADESQLWDLYLERAAHQARDVNTDMNQVCVDLADSLQSRFAIAECTSPLLDCDSDVNEYRFSNGTVLRVMRDDERDFIAGILKEDENAPFSRECAAATHVITRQRTVDKRHFSFPIEESAFDDVILSLKLVKPGMVSIGRMFLSGVVYPPFGLRSAPGVLVLSVFGAKRDALSGPQFTLNFSALAKADRFLNGVPRARDNRLLAHAINRFLFGYERDRKEDELVDSWIALEALFLKREEQAELSFKASLRLARFLGQQPYEREWLSEAARKSYSARSKVVHGEPAPPGVDNIAGFTQEVLRRTLASCIMAGNPPPIAELDRAAVRSQVQGESA